MTKVLTVDDIEVEFEKQNSSVSCKWCVYLRVRKDNKEKLLVMFKTKNIPYTRFSYCGKNTVINSKRTLIEILSTAPNNIKEQKN
jgi:hypothetical protein